MLFSSDHNLKAKSRSFRICFGLAAASALIAPMPAGAQTSSPAPSALSTPAPLHLGIPYGNTSPAGMHQPTDFMRADRGVGAADAPGGKSQKNEWLAAPVPIYDPTVGAGVVFGVGYLFHPDPSDTVSPTSMVIGFAGGTSNGTWLAGGLTRLNLFEDRFRLTLAAAHASVNYQFFGIGSAAAFAGRSVDVTQTADGAFLQPLFQTFPHLYIGPEYLIADISMTARNSLSLPDRFPTIPNTFSSRIAALGLVMQWDDTDSQFFPTRGSFYNAKVDFFDPAFGGEPSFQHFVLNGEQYLSLSPCQVLAFRETFETVTGDPPVYMFPAAGMGGDFRGYQAGKYRDRYLLAAQVEYRHRLSEHWGFVVFGSIGEVAPSLPAISSGDLLPSAGAGLRYALSTDKRVNFRLDLAGGRDGLVVYFGVGEAF